MKLVQGWKQEVVGDLFEVQLGKMINAEARSGNDHYPYMTNCNVQWGQIKLDDIRRMHFSEKDKEKFKLKYGDLLVCEGGEVGRCAIWKDQIGECYYQKALHRLRPKSNEILNKFTYYFLEFAAGSRLISDNTSRSSIAHLTREKFIEILLPVPPLPEQKKIAEILGTCDEAIEAQERLIAQKQQRKKGLMQQLLTGRVRFPQFAGMSCWTMVPLSKVSTRINEKAGEQELDVLSITAGRGFVSQKEKFSKVIAGRNYANYTVLRNGEFAYNKGNSDRFPQGCIYRLDEYEIGAVPNVFYSFCLDSDVTVCGFFVQLFKMGYQNKQLRAYINSGVRNDGLLNLNAKDFFKMKVPLPGIEEQQALADFFGDQDVEITLQQNKLEQLKQQKKGLMQQLLTGKVRVRV